MVSFWGQEVKGQGRRKLQLDLDAWRIIVLDPVGVEQVL